MAIIKVNTDKKIKKMKPMHGGGQPPIGGVDIPNIFRDFDADENDPNNYDFTFTDYLINALIEADVEPYYRLGTTIENSAYIKAYRIYPPKDAHKWARICEHIIRHYTEGWADGYNHKIRYWEIWNEPEVQDMMMWMGTDEEFYRLYDITAKHLKSCFPHLKIGGYASCGFYAVAPETVVDPETSLPGTIPPTAHEEKLMRFFYGFFDYIKKHNSPIDFFSWHSYSGVSRVTVMDEWLHKELKRIGFGGLETHLNEWNPCPAEFGTAHHSAEVAAMLLALQCGHTDVCCIYDMRTNTTPYAALFDVRTHKPIHAYYSL